MILDNVTYERVAGPKPGFCTGCDLSNRKHADCLKYESARPCGSNEHILKVTK